MLPPATPVWARRLLGAFGEPTGKSALRQHHEFTRWLLGYLAARDWMGFVIHQEAFRLGLALTLSAIVLSSLVRLSLAHVALAALASTLKLLVLFPHNANHQILECLILLMLCVAGQGSAQQSTLSLQALRGVTILTFFWSGLQKVLYGTYFDGAFLGTRLHLAHFSQAFEYILPADELQRLATAARAGAPGPYALDSVLGLVLSNAAYLGELLLAGALLIPRLRKWAILFGIGLVVAIEAVAREFMFGILAINLLTLFSNQPWATKLRRATQVACWALVLMQLWIGQARLFN